MTTPAFRIVSDGEDITKLISDRLVSLRINDQAGQQSDSLEIALDDRDHLLPIPRSGAWLRVWLGYSSNGQLPVYMGAFAVDEVELSMGPRSMVVKATAAQTAPELVKQQRSKSWHDTTLGAIAQQIGKQNGLQVTIKGSLASVQIKHEDQTNESDQAFLTRLAEKYKATIKPADGKLVIVPRGGEFGGTVTVDVTEVTSWRATLKNRGAYGEVKAKYLNRTTNKEATITSGSKGSLPTFEDKQLYRSQAEAEKAAASKLQSLNSGEVSINLQMQGRPQVNAEGLVTLTNFRPQVDGTWNIKTVTHDLSGSGYVTTIDCGTKGDENNSWASGAGANDGKAPTEKAAALASAATSSRGMNTSGGPGNGENACVYAVNRVLRKAGLSSPWGGSNYMPDVKAALDRSATLLSGPEPGAIAVMQDSGGPIHIGIVQSNGSIISNSSSNRSFSWVGTPSSYASYYGRSPVFYRLK